MADGAFTPDGELVGLVFGLTGLRDGKLAHWSHILAVEKKWRDRGIGRLLKAHQRDKLLEIGVDSMFWTFDPLESRNAHLNLNRLGTTVEEYVPHFYGANTVAKTDTVIGTDRFVVRWDLVRSPSPSASRNLSLTDIPCVAARPQSRGSQPPKAPLVVAEKHVRIEVPADIQALKSAEPEMAAQWREITRQAFVHYLDAGYRVVEFRRDPEGRGGSYVLEAREK